MHPESAGDGAAIRVLCRWPLFDTAATAGQSAALKISKNETGYRGGDGQESGDKKNRIHRAWPLLAVPPLPIQFGTASVQTHPSMTGLKMGLRQNSFLPQT